MKKMNEGMKGNRKMSEKERETMKIVCMNDKRKSFMTIIKDESEEKKKKKEITKRAGR